MYVNLNNIWYFKDTVPYASSRILPLAITTTPSIDGIVVGQSRETFYNLGSDWFKRVTCFTIARLTTYEPIRPRASVWTNQTPNKKLFVLIGDNDHIYGVSHCNGQAWNSGKRCLEQELSLLKEALLGRNICLPYIAMMRWLGFSVAAALRNALLYFVNNLILESLFISGNRSLLETLFLEPVIALTLCCRNSANF